LPTAAYRRLSGDGEVDERLGYPRVPVEPLELVGEAIGQLAVVRILARDFHKDDRRGTFEDRVQGAFLIVAQGLVARQAAGRLQQREGQAFRDVVERFFHMDHPTR
jgi:hypothetical protein